MTDPEGDIPLDEEYDLYSSDDFEVAEDELPYRGLFLRDE